MRTRTTMVFTGAGTGDAVAVDEVWEDLERVIIRLSWEVRCARCELRVSGVYQDLPQ